MALSPFVVYDCSLVQRATGQSVSNLRELLRAVREMDGLVLEHHMMHCPLSDRFELDEFPNDFARWCWEDLGDRVTGERLGLIDPFRHESIEEVRREILDVIEERLWLADRAIPSCQPGIELHLIGSQLVAFDTGVRLESPGALAEALPRMSLRSLYYHVHEGRSRTQGKTDDFSAWLEANGAPADLVKNIREIDFYFLNLTQLREALIQAFRPHFPAYEIPLGVAS
jgi:Family of unknown function (DUF5752)